MEDIRKLLNAVRQKRDVLAAAKFLYRSRLAPDFTPFQFMQVDELFLSRLIAWLLDPHESHGQGIRFLHRFAQRLKSEGGQSLWDEEICSGAAVSTEYNIPNVGRLDIMVRSQGRVIAIENKPWAGDQTDQLQRYLSHLDRQAESNYCLIYMTADGRSPPNESICTNKADHYAEAGNLILWSYRDTLSEWLAECRMDCRADRVSTFLDEFGGYINREFKGVADMTEEDRLLQEITDSPENVHSAMQIAAAKEAMQMNLLDRLRLEIEAEATSREWSLALWEMHYWERYSKFQIEINPGSKYQFGISFENAQLNNLIYGLIKKIPRVRDDGDARMFSRINGEVASGRTSEHWVWYRYASPEDAVLPVERHWASGASPWVSIQKHEMSKLLIEAATKLSRFCASE